MTDKQQLVDRIAFLLQTSGEAQVRVGDRRTVKAARDLLKAGAAEIGVEVTTKSKDGAVFAKIKGD